MKSKALKIAFCLETIVLVVLIVLIFFSVRTKRTTELLRETSPNGDFVIVVSEKGEPDWPFGPAHVEVSLFETGDSGYRVSIESEVHNDGGHAGVQVAWLEESVQIVLSGKEQPDAAVLLPLRTLTDP